MVKTAPGDMFSLGNREPRSSLVFVAARAEVMTSRWIVRMSQYQRHLLGVCTVTRFGKRERFSATACNNELKGLSILMKEMELAL